MVLEDLVQRLLEPFSDRRRRILEGILAGQPVNQIALQVGTSERTVFNTRLAAARILSRFSRASEPAVAKFLVFLKNRLPISAARVAL